MFYLIFWRALFTLSILLMFLCKGKLPLSVFLVINDNPYGLMFSLSFFVKELFIGIA
jgi:hypothetical protein